MRYYCITLSRFTVHALLTVLLVTVYDHDLRHFGSQVYGLLPMNTFYVTTPIYYANSLPHLGHLTRWSWPTRSRAPERQQGIETYLLTGTDEHGINIERAAERAGRTPQEQADYVVSYYKKMTAEFGLDTEHGGYDIFMRTTEPFHYQGVSEFWRRVAQSKNAERPAAHLQGALRGMVLLRPVRIIKPEDEYLEAKESR